MLSRIELAQELLSNDGFLVINIYEGVFIAILIILAKMRSDIVAK